jgi:hypothetical protein
MTEKVFSFFNENFNNTAVATAITTMTQQQRPLLSLHKKEITATTKM